MLIYAMSSNKFEHPPMSGAGELVNVVNFLSYTIGSELSSVILILIKE